MIQIRWVSPEGIEFKASRTKDEDELEVRPNTPNAVWERTSPARFPHEIFSKMLDLAVGPKRKAARPFELKSTRNGEYPKRREDVLVWDGDRWFLATFRADPDSPDYYWDCDTFGFRKDEVIAWTRLPRKPKAATNERRDSK